MVTSTVCSVVFDKGTIVVLFNGFQKKTRKTPQNEIEKALKKRLHMMDTRHKIKSYSKVLSERYGELDTPERVEFENEALDFYASQVALFNREESKFAPKELSNISKAGENPKIAL